MSNLLKKLTLSLLSALIVLFSFAPYLSVKAADPPSPTPAPVGTWYNPGFAEWWSKVYDPSVSPESEIFGERYTAAQVKWVFYSVMALIINNVISPELVSCFLTNTTNLNACASLLTTTAPITNVAIAQPETLPSLLSLVFATDRPISGISYVREKVSNFSLVPVAKAQGVGFGYNALSVVQDMWAASRNVAFGLFVLAAIIFAFMIMFRVKISPQVVISVQSAIPKLIIALILVTFSYAIAGFMVDLMYVLYGLLSLVGRSFFPALNIDPRQLFLFLTAGRLGAIGPVGIDTGIFGLIAVYLIFFAFVFLVAVFYTVGVIPGALAAITGIGFVSLALPLFIILGAIIFVIVLIILIWHCIKIIFTLLKAYANILLLTIFAPLQLVIGIFVPTLSFGSWIKSFFSNLAVFLVVSALTFLSFVFLYFGLYYVSVDVFGGTGIDGVVMGFLKVFIGTSITSAIVNLTTPASWPPLLGSGVSGSNSGMTALLMVGVSFVMFTLIPKAAEIVQGFVSGKPFAYGTAVGEAITQPITSSIKAVTTTAAVNKELKLGDLAKRLDGLLRRGSGAPPIQ
jgi:hypothetical protein